MKFVWLLLLGGALSLAFLTIWLGRKSGIAVGQSAMSPSVKALDLSGQPVDPFQTSNSHALVFVFVSVDCPISNRYAPEVRRLAAEFVSNSVAFRLVYPNADETSEKIKKHLKDYNYTLEAFRDPQHELTRAMGAKVTPEAVVFARSQGIVYRGRIDDRFEALGKERLAPTQNDLRDALKAIIAGRPVPHPSARAVGCYISDVP